MPAVCVSRLEPDAVAAVESYTCLFDLVDWITEISLALVKLHLLGRWGEGKGKLLKHVLRAFCP